MTRDGDQYVDLDDRVDIAREANASLFISVHADTLSEDANVSGSTVYTVADRASDAEAARIAARENAADRRPAEASGGRSGRRRHSVRPQATRDPDLRPHLLARSRRQPARRGEAQPQPGTLGGLRRSEGAGISLRARRTRLSFERPGRPVPDLPGVAGQDGRGHGQSHRRVLCRIREAGQRPIGRKPASRRQARSRRAAWRIKACAQRSRPGYWRARYRRETRRS